MKSGLVLIATSAVFLVSGIASGKDVRDVPPYTHQTVQDDANASAQSNTDMSYGGVPDTRSTSGNSDMRSCVTGPRCNLYFGR